MTAFLRQSTASQSRLLGPFVDDTDGKTAETGLTIANTDIKLMVNGAASANKNSGGGTHRTNGFYGVTFDATDTATVGEVVVSVAVAGALPVWTRFFVLEEAVFDALFAASAAGPLDAAATRSALGMASANLDTQLADLPTVSEFNARTLVAADYFVVTDYTAPLDASGTRAAIGLASANLDTQLADLPTVAEFNARTIVSADYFVVSDYTAPLDASGTRAALGLATANLDTQLADLPTVAEFNARSLPSADYFVVGDYTAPASAATIADAVWDEAIADHSATGSTGAALAAAGGSGDPWATALPGAYSAGTAGYIVGTFIDEAISGISGGTDWTSDEKEEIRYRLGIDGTATAPSTATGAKLGDVEMTQLEIDASATVGKKPVRLVGNTSNYLIEMSDVDSAVTYGFNMDGGFSGDVEGKVLGIGSSTITGTGVQAQLPAGAISETTIAAETLTASKFSTALSGLWTNLIAMITGSGASAAFTEKAVENVPGGAGSDPLENAVPGAYAPGTAGYVIGTNLDVPVSGVSAAAQGDWAITRTFENGDGDKISGVRMSLVGVAGKSDTTGSNGIAVVKTDDGTYTLRVVVPIGYEDVADAAVVVDGSDDTATVVLTLTAVTPADPPLCAVVLPITDQFGAPLAGVAVDFKFTGFADTASPDSVVVNPPQPATSDDNGLVSVNLLRLGQYTAIYSVASGSVTKRVDISVPDLGSYIVVEPV